MQPFIVHFYQTIPMLASLSAGPAIPYLHGKWSLMGKFQQAGSLTASLTFIGCMYPYSRRSPDLLSDFCPRDRHGFVHESKTEPLSILSIQNIAKIDLVFECTDHWSSCLSWTFAVLELPSELLHALVNWKKDFNYAINHQRTYHLTNTKLNPIPSHSIKFILFDQIN